MPVDLNGSRVLLTGATGGIGHAIARALHARGADLILTGRKAAVLDELTSELGDRAEAKPLDLADAEAVHRFAADVGEIDVLVANAGLPGTGQISDYSSEQIDRVVDVNLRSPIHLTHALLPGMLERGGGRLVFISSDAARVGSTGEAVYSACKSG